MAAAPTVHRFAARTVERRLFVGSEALRTIDVARLRGLQAATAFKPELSLDERSIEVARHTLEGVEHLFEVNPAAAVDLVRTVGLTLEADGIAEQALVA